MFDKVHEKYSIPNKETRTYHHYFYEVDKDINGEYFSLNELLQKEKVNENEYTEFIKKSSWCKEKRGKSAKKIPEIQKLKKEWILYSQKIMQKNNW